MLETTDPNGQETVHEQFESLLAVRNSLISEIEEHFSNGDLVHLIDQNEVNDVLEDDIENFTYEIYTKKGKHLSGKTNGEEPDSDPELSKLLELAEDDQPSEFNALLSLYQEGIASDSSNGQQIDIGAQTLDTNVMFDPATGEGLICIHGRCISNKKKM